MSLIGYRGLSQNLALEPSCLVDGPGALCHHLSAAPSASPLWESHNASDLLIVSSEPSVFHVCFSTDRPARLPNRGNCLSTFLGSGHTLCTTKYISKCFLRTSVDRTAGVFQGSPPDSSCAVLVSLIPNAILTQPHWPTACTLRELYSVHPFTDEARGCLSSPTTANPLGWKSLISIPDTVVQSCPCETHKVYGIQGQPLAQKSS